MCTCRSIRPGISVRPATGTVTSAPLNGRSEISRITPSSTRTCPGRRPGLVPSKMFASRNNVVLKGDLPASRCACAPVLIRQCHTQPAGTTSRSLARTSSGATDIASGSGVPGVWSRRSCVRCGIQVGGHRARVEGHAQRPAAPARGADDPVVRTPGGGEEHPQRCRGRVGEAERPPLDVAVVRGHHDPLLPLRQEPHGVRQHRCDRMGVVALDPAIDHRTLDEAGLHDEGREPVSLHQVAEQPVPQQVRLADAVGKGVRRSRSVPSLVLLRRSREPARLSNNERK